MSHPIKSPRKLIEVALPLDLINEAAKDEKSVPRRGHPQTLHIWWARRPLAAARGVIFAQLVNDPGYQQGGGFKYGMNKKDAAEERKRLFKIIEELVKWENSSNEVVLERARAEIRRSWREVCELNKDHPQAASLFNPEAIPALHDPFSGGGSIPLEAQRLGLAAYATDLNPVAVLISKAMIEIPPKYSGQSPVSVAAAVENGDDKDLGLEREWPGASGLAEDVRYYGSWMQAEAHKRIGHLYPPIEIVPEMARDRPDLKPLVGKELTVLAWLWARTVKSPNPAFSHVDVPLATTFVLSIKAGKQTYVQPVIQGDVYRFTVKVGTPPSGVDSGTTAGKRAGFICLVSGSPIDYTYIRAEGSAGRMGQKLMAVVVESPQGRLYLPPTDEMESVAASAAPTWKPDTETHGKCRVNIGLYGLTKWGDLFTPRQLAAVTTFSDLLAEAEHRVRRGAVERGMLDDGKGLDAKGVGATAYAQSISVYLACALSRLASYNNTICHWNMRGGSVGGIFSRQAIGMSWDYIEVNPLEKMSGNWAGGIEWVCDVLSELVLAKTTGFAEQADAGKQEVSAGKVISTDPPYYDNIGYADLSDFFYVWLRPSMRQIFPNLFSTLVAPKADELVATPYRHGTKEKAEAFFLSGMTMAMHRLADQAHPAFPTTIYYAFKQSESDGKLGTISPGWDTFLHAVIRSGFAISGTWPMRTERTGRPVEIESNALASSIVLVCRKRTDEATTISRREFIRELNIVLPDALDEMTKGAGGEYSPVAPVDLSQAIIGPGMAVFSKYAAVLEANGEPMSVRTALQLINRFLAEDDFDPDTQWCLRWFEQYGWAEGVYGEADVLARSKSISVDGLAEAGVVVSGGGKVNLRKWADYPGAWNPKGDTRTPIWETLHQLIRALKQDGESGAGKLLAAVKAQGEATRQLAYRLYTLCERQGWAEDARAYNELITSWTGIESAAGQVPSGQGEFFQ
jgi:putative DNA methylase